MTRSMLGRAALCEMMRMRWRSDGNHLHELAPPQHQGLQALQFGIGQRLDEALTLGVLHQHPGEGRQHPGVQRIGPGQSPHRARKVARRARVDHRHCQAAGLQGASGLELVAARDFQHRQCWCKRRQLAEQVFQIRLRRCRPAESWHAHCWPPPAFGWRHRFLTQTASDTSLRPYPCPCELQVPTTVRAARKDAPTRAPKKRASTTDPEAARATRLGPPPKGTADLFRPRADKAPVLRHHALTCSGGEDASCERAFPTSSTPAGRS